MCQTALVHAALTLFQVENTATGLDGTVKGDIKFVDIMPDDVDDGMAYVALGEAHCTLQVSLEVTIVPLGTATAGQ